MTPDQILKMGDYAAVQSDRWLMVVLLIVFLVAVWLLGRWGLKRIEAVEKQFHDYVLQQGEKTLMALTECRVALTSTSEIVREAADIIKTTRQK